MLHVPPEMLYSIAVYVPGVPAGRHSGLVLLFTAQGPLGVVVIVQLVEHEEPVAIAVDLRRDLHEERIDVDQREDDEHRV